MQWPDSAKNFNPYKVNFNQKDSKLKPEIGDFQTAVHIPLVEHESFFGRMLK